MTSEELTDLLLVAAVYAESALPAVPTAGTAGEPQCPEIIPIAQKKPRSHRKILFKEVLQELCHFQSLSCSGKHLLLHVSFNLF